MENLNDEYMINHLLGHNKLLIFRMRAKNKTLTMIRSKLRQETPFRV